MPHAPPGAFAIRALLRSHRRVHSGIVKVDKGLSFRSGAQTAVMSINAFFARYHCKNKNKKYKNTKLHWTEEREVVKNLLLQRHPLGFVPIPSIRDATVSVVQALTAQRREEINFPKGGPSRTFCKSFAERHCYAIYSTSPVEKGAPMLTATEIVKYFADLTKMITNDKLYSDNIWCLTCRTVQVDIGQGPRMIKFLSVVAIVNASGKMASLIHFVHNGDVREAVMSTPRFQDWLSYVSEGMQKPPVPESVIPRPYQLLLCDESLDFMNSKTRDWLFLKDIIVYSIPGLGDGIPGNHDVGCADLWPGKFHFFFEMELNENWTPKEMYKEGTLLTSIRLAADMVLNEENIKRSFSDAGIFPLDEVRFYKHPRPLSYENRDIICDMGRMCAMVDNALKENK